MARLNPYIGFRGKAREALEFYRSVFGGELEIMTFGEMGDPDGPEAGLVMHGRLETPQGFTLMAADAPDKMGLASETFVTICISGDDPQLQEFWDKLSDGGDVEVAFEKQPWVTSSVSAPTSSVSAGRSTSESPAQPAELRRPSRRTTGGGGPARPLPAASRPRA